MLPRAFESVALIHFTICQGGYAAWLDCLNVRSHPLCPLPFSSHPFSSHSVCSHPFCSLQVRPHQSCSHHSFCSHPSITAGQGCFNIATLALYFGLPLAFGQAFLGNPVLAFLIGLTHTRVIGHSNNWQWLLWVEILLLLFGKALLSVAAR